MSFVNVNGIKFHVAQNTLCVNHLGTAGPGTHCTLWDKKNGCYCAPSGDGTVYVEDAGDYAFVQLPILEVQDVAAFVKGARNAHSSSATSAPPAPPAPASLPPSSTPATTTATSSTGKRPETSQGSAAPAAKKKKTSLLERKRMAQAGVGL
eukprot:TRINITY_DN26882_c0_g1_i1.p2 TRINITY_DN26882_c0_g1~~TRINITY_DN26882_c0_g1_i1.p2  ORF type:complete len:151 (+),score=10.61 TRINITY_DN26882_c0_g1_i1:67-519(+)